MKRLFILCFIITILLPCFAIGEESVIGKTKTGKGNVVVIRSGKEIPINIGDKLYQKDIIRTGADSSVGIIFEDNTILSLGPKSEIVIDEYVFAPEKGIMSMIIRMVKGTASYISGIIGRQSPESVKFQTPDATIGIRGTQFLVQVKEDNQCPCSLQ
ncbi:MAG: FecR domain-containing protein [Smithella sp.]|jgi:hypothetical protein